MTRERSTLSRLVVALVWGTCALLLSVFLAAWLGAQHLDFARAFSNIDGPNSDAVLLFEVRLPRVLLGAFAGAALGAVGAALQALLRNPLADPYVLGTSGGAALGATIAIAIGVPAAMAAVTLPIWAFLGALAATFLVWAIARAGAGATPTGVILAGIVINAFASAAITFVKVLVSSTQAQELLFWLVGSIGYERKGTLTVLGIYVLVGVVVLTALAGRMNILSLGDDAAATLGVRVRRVRWTIFAAAAMLVGGVTSLCGLIGFVGLVVPHAARLALGPDNRLVVPTSALFGGAFLVLADLASRLLFDAFGTEPPVGAITALIGCPVFLVMLVRSRAGRV
ncbi:MAG: iron ABC transporter permease [Sandaracinaceae bacterium]|nr:iron ABC transporter permease [Sandaracinaceae bacterium]